MTEKTEWEVVDAPPEDGQRPGETAQGLLGGLFGPYWRWKMLGTAVVTGLVLVFLVAVAGTVLLGALAIGTLAFFVRKAIHWLGSQESSALKPFKRS